MKTPGERITWTDYILLMVATVSAVYSLGMSLTKPNLAIFLAVASAIAITIGGALGHSFRDKPIVKSDGYFAAILGVALVTQSFRINDMLPDEGFPFRLIIGATLSILVISTSLFAWRDATILFVTLPGLAMFGLVGTFDTYQPAVFLFFLFLSCAALLYSRTHYRGMVAKAKESGIEEIHLLHRGPWRWMAGSEWALGSAGVIIVLSLIGAPVVRTGVRTIAPNPTVNFNPPTNNQPQTGNDRRNAATDARVGRGPIELTDDPAFEASSNAGMYLRISTYERYTGSGWQYTRDRAAQPGAIFGDTILPERQGEQGGWVGWKPDGTPPLEPIDNPTYRRVIIRDIDYSTSVIPSPGPVAEVFGKDINLIMMSNGQVAVTPRQDAINRYEFNVAEPTLDPREQPSIDPRSRITMDQVNLWLENYDAQDGANAFTNLAAEEGVATSERARQWFRDAAEGATTDFEKAEAIRSAISGQIRYNTQASAVPSDADAVDHVLFVTQEGYCDLFATAMTLGAREVGLTSRYVTGFVNDIENPTEDGFTQIRENQAHSWAEVYFDGVGWVPFDATIGSEVVPGGWRYEEGVSGFMRIFQSPITRAIGIGLGALALLFVLWLAIQRLQVLRGNVVRDPVAFQKRESMRVHRNFIRTLERATGTPKRFSMSTPEYISYIRGELGSNLAPEADDLAHRFDRLFFGPGTVAREIIAELEKDVREFGKSLQNAKKARA